MTKPESHKYTENAKRTEHTYVMGQKQGMFWSLAKCKVLGPTFRDHIMVRLKAAYPAARRRETLLLNNNCNGYYSRKSLFEKLTTLLSEPSSWKVQEFLICDRHYCDDMAQIKRDCTHMRNLQNTLVPILSQATIALESVGWCYISQLLRLKQRTHKRLVAPNLIAFITSLMDRMNAKQVMI